MKAPVKETKGTVAIIGSGPAGLFAAWALLQDNYEVTVFEKHDHLTLARQAEMTKGEATVDIPMRTFSAGYYANLFQILEYLSIETTIHRFHYTFFHGFEQYFTFFSNFHQILPCLLGNSFWINAYLFACYLWYTVAVFLLPPYAKGFGTAHNGTKTETLGEYASRICLPDMFLDWYLLPLFASVSTCSHADLRQCPAVYIANYRRRTFGAHHRTITNMQAFQAHLTQGIIAKTETEVHSVKPWQGKVVVTFSKVGDNTNTNMHTQTFDHVVLATSAKQSAMLSPVIGEIADGLNEGRVRITVSKPDRVRSYSTSEVLVLTTVLDPTMGHVTSAKHHHPAGVDVVVSPCLTTGFQQNADGDEVIYLTRPLPSPRSHDLLLNVFGKDGNGRNKEWKNGQDGIYLVGGYASAALPLLEACVRSGLEAAAGIGAKLPFDIMRSSPF
ncbi:hypothetical protein BJX99DRAFT_256665 [Aspergillus californicus]